MLDLRLNPGRPARPGDQRVRRLPRPWRDRLDARPRSRRDVSASTPSAGDLTRRQAGDRAGQWRFGLARRKSSPARCRIIRRATFVGTRRSARVRSRPSFRSARNGALRLTTALYYTPSGKSIQGKGITPDIKVDQPLPRNCRARRDARRIRPQGPHQGRRRKHRLGIGSLCAAGSEGRRATELRARPSARQEAEPAFPPNPNCGIPN